MYFNYSTTIRRVEWLYYGSVSLNVSPLLGSMVSNRYICYYVLNAGFSGSWKIISHGKGLEQSWNLIRTWASQGNDVKSWQKVMEKD